MRTEQMGVDVRPDLVRNKFDFLFCNELHTQTHTHCCKIYENIDSAKWHVYNKFTLVKCIICDVCRGHTSRAFNPYIV